VDQGYGGSAKGDSSRFSGNLLAGKYLGTKRQLTVARAQNLAQPESVSGIFAYISWPAFSLFPSTA